MNKKYLDKWNKVWVAKRHPETGEILLWNDEAGWGGWFNGSNLKQIL